MSKLLKQILAVVLALQTSLSGISTIVHAEEPEEEPEYSAETITEEEETVLSEEGDEENSIVISEEEQDEPETPTVEEGTEEEEPPVTEEPEITEEPQETETPEVTEPEETEEPAVAEEPEETEVPEVTEPEEAETPAVEEPEEPEEPEVTEPEETEEPWEEPEELLELDDSEPFQLQITPKGTSTNVYPTSVTYVSESTYKVYFGQNINVKSYIVAVKDEVAWFLKASDSTSPASYSYNVKFDIPGGEYKLHIAYFDGNGDFYLSERFYTLVVFDAPEVAGTMNFTGNSYGYIDVDLSPVLKHWEVGSNFDGNTLYLYISETNPEASRVQLPKMGEYLHDGIYRVYLGDPNAYGGAGYHKSCMPYGGFDLSFKLLGTETVKNGWIYTSSSTTHVDILSEFVPNEMRLYTDKSLDVSIPADGIADLCYKGATAQLMVEFGPLSGDGTEYEGIDRRVTYTSSDPKLVKVDANGTVTVVGLPPANDALQETKVTITAKSVAYPELTATCQVALLNISKKSEVRVVYEGQKLSTLNWTIGKQAEHDHFAEVNFFFEDPDNSVVFMPVTFTVNKEGLPLYNTPVDNNSYREGNTYTAYYFTEDGEKAYVHAEEPGTYTVNASTPIGQSGSVTINVDGITNTIDGAATKDSQFIVSGKAVTGWVRYDTLTDSYVYGKDVFKGLTDPANQHIYYVDPQTKKLVTGDASAGYPDTVKKIDGKLYVFNAVSGLVFYTSDGQPAEGWIRVNSEMPVEYHGHIYDAYALVTGELVTGWKDTDEGLLYFNKDYGYVTCEAFVPARSGKGMLYVDNYGEPVGYHFNDGPGQYMTDKDGLYELYVNGNYRLFWVKNGAFHTGWLYLHEDKNHNFIWNTSSKNALEKMYFDPKDNGAMAEGDFMLSGKKYSVSSTYYTSTFRSDYKTVKTIYGLGKYYDVKYPEKYTIENDYVIDANGALVCNKMVKIAVLKSDKTFDRYYVYANEQGKLTREEWVAVNGKMFYFDSNGRLVTDAMYATPWSYLDNNHNWATVYSKLKDPKKPQAGYYYYSNGGKKLTSLAFYTNSDNIAAVVDAKGNLAVNGVVTVKRSLVPGEESVTYITDENGQVIKADGNYMMIVDVNKKNYVVDRYGIVQKNSEVPFYASYSYGRSGYVMADKNGVLIKKAFRTISDSISGTYKVWLNEYGFAGGYSSTIYQNEIYYTSVYANKKAWLLLDSDGGYDKIIIPGKTIIPGTDGATYKTGWIGGEDSPVYLNKDGSIKTGFVKHGNHKYYIATNQIGYVYKVHEEVLSLGFEDRSNVLFKIKGKIYYFDKKGEVVTGWVHFDRAMIFDINDYSMENPTNVIYLNDPYMYFDPKTGAAATGTKSVLTPALFNGEISLGAEGAFANNAKRVNTTSTQKTLRFDKNGALYHDQEVVINKKLTIFGPDGVALSGTNHWADADKEM